MLCWFFYFVVDNISIIIFYVIFRKWVPWMMMSWNMSRRTYTNTVKWQSRPSTCCCRFDVFLGWGYCAHTSHADHQRLWCVRDELGYLLVLCASDLVYYHSQNSVAEFNIKSMGHLQTKSLISRFYLDLFYLLDKTQFEKASFFTDPIVCVSCHKCVCWCLCSPGMADCVMAIGFEKMERGPLKGKVLLCFWLCPAFALTRLTGYLSLFYSWCSHICEVDVEEMNFIGDFTHHLHACMCIILDILFVLL